MDSRLSAPSWKDQLQRTLEFMLKYGGTGPGPDGKTTAIAPIHPSITPPAVLDFLNKVGSGILLPSPKQKTSDEIRPVWSLSPRYRGTRIGQHMLVEQGLSSVPGNERCQVYLVDWQLLQRLYEWIVSGSFPELQSREDGEGGIELYYQAKAGDVQPDFLLTLNA